MKAATSELVSHLAGEVTTLATCWKITRHDDVVFGFTEVDLRVGRYDFAEIRMFLVNYQDLSQGILKLRRGWLGEVSIRDGVYVAELRGTAQKLQMTVGEIYTPDCAADLGDTRLWRRPCGAG